MARYGPTKHHRPFDDGRPARAQGRRSIRLKGYDYAQAGAYFVTLCAQGHDCVFGEIVDDERAPNAAGQMVQIQWEQLPERFPTVQLDAYVVMPNHFHAILIITDDPATVGTTAAGTATVGAGLVPAPNGATTDGATTRVAPTDDCVGATANGATTRVAPTGGAPTLGNIVGAFKSLTTNAYVRGVRELGWPPFQKQLWQRNYYERIIRNKRELNAVREYIANNPIHWALDNENPNRRR